MFSTQYAAVATVIKLVIFFIFHVIFQWPENALKALEVLQSGIKKYIDLYFSVVLVRRMKGLKWDNPL